MTEIRYAKFKLTGTSWDGSTSGFKEGDIVECKRSSRESLWKIMNSGWAVLSDGGWAGVRLDGADYGSPGWTREEMDLDAFDDEDPNVDHPDHYNSDPSGIECLTIVRHRNFNVGNAMKYLWRNGLKADPGGDLKKKQIEDLRKAIFYIEDEIKRLEEAE